MANYKIMAGAIDIDDIDAQLTDIKSSQIHPNYTANFKNDVCLLTLSSNLTYNDNVKNIPLNTKDLPANTKCVVSGWGTTYSGGLFTSDVLKYAEVHLCSQTECKEAYGGLFNDEMMICAYDKGKDSCQGDSGGPFVCNNKLAGIVSWGAGCAREGIPGVYANVENYVKWIEDNSQDSGMENFRPMLSLVAASFLWIKMLN